MPKLHIYINGTPNGTDGEEVTSLTFKNTRKYMNNYNEFGFSSNELSRAAYPLLFFLRFESGYKGTVTIKRLIDNITFKAIGTSFPTEMVNVSDYTSTIDVTDKNCLVIAFPTLIDPNRDTTTARKAGFSDIPLSDMFSFSYIEQKA